MTEHELLFQELLGAPFPSGRQAEVMRFQAGTSWEGGHRFSFCPHLTLYAPAPAHSLPSPGWAGPSLHLAPSLGSLVLAVLRGRGALPPFAWWALTLTLSAQGKGQAASMSPKLLIQLCF